MKQISIFIYYTAIVVIISWFLLPILGIFIHFQITNEKLSLFYMAYRAFSLPLAILLTLFGTIKPKENWVEATKKFLWTILAIGASLIFVFIGFWGGMCEWATSKVLYKNKKNDGVTIALRNYDCGAYDNDIPKRKLYKVYQITPYFIFFHQTDTTGIDTSIWVPPFRN